MYKAVVLKLDHMVVARTEDGPEHKTVQGRGVAMCRSPKKAIELATAAAVREFVDNLPETVLNQVGFAPRVKLFDVDGNIVYDSNPDNTKPRGGIRRLPPYERR